MVRRRVASEKRRMAVGLRQCIRPSVEAVTPGHDGYPLAFVLINWTAWKRPFPRSGFESVGETHCHLYFPPADLAGTVFPKQCQLNRSTQHFLEVYSKPTLGMIRNAW